MAMSKKLYNLMDWAEIEAVTYSEEDHPKGVLGAHPVRGGQTLVTAYRPDAKKMALKFKGEKKSTEMELADEEGYFAILVKNREPFDYSFIITDENGDSHEEYDPYSFPGVLNKRDIQKFSGGIHYKSYDVMGAKVMESAGVAGVHFAIWAPSAIRVSVVGDFNRWDGRIHQMEKLWDSGVYELFIPGVKKGDRYKYEIKMKNGICILKNDPYEFDREEGDDGASIVKGLHEFEFTDDEWIEKRDKKKFSEGPVAICEIDTDKLFEETKSIKKLAQRISEYATDNGYTHVLLDGATNDYDPLFCPSATVLSCDGLMNLINELHKKDIGVILNWNTVKFPDGVSGLSLYDGSCLYEDPDEKRSFYPGGGYRYFNTGRNEVKNLLIANALYLILVFHADGLKVNDVARLLYLDYDKGPGQWTPNMYGGNENLDAIDYFKHLNSVIKKLSGSILMTADDESVYPDITKDVDDDGCGFSLKINNGWFSDVSGYLSYEPLSRSAHYNEVCFPMVYQYNERFLLPLSKSKAGYGRRSLYDMMSGDDDEKFSNLRALYSFFMFHPGKKLIYPGLSIPERLDDRFCLCLKDLLGLYRKEKALYGSDDLPECFEWINNISANENILVFVRYSADKKELILCVVNFLSIPRKEYKIGVPRAGKYTEIFNSDAEKYGGFGFVNQKGITSKKDECDMREDSVRVRVAPMSVTLFKHSDT